MTSEDERQIELEISEQWEHYERLMQEVDYANKPKSCINCGREMVLDPYKHEGAIIMSSHITCSVQCAIDALEQAMKLEMESLDGEDRINRDRDETSDPRTSKEDSRE